MLQPLGPQSKPSQAQGGIMEPPCKLPLGFRASPVPSLSSAPDTISVAVSPVTFHRAGVLQEESPDSCGLLRPAWPSAWISPETGSREGKGSSVGEIGQRGHWCVKAGQRGKCLSQIESRHHSAIHNPALPEDRSSASYLPLMGRKKMIGGGEFGGTM